MAIEIQFCMKDYSDRSDDYCYKCSYCHEGVLYYPDVNASDIGGYQDTFYAMCRCTECDYDTRASTSPKYMMFRVVVKA